MTVLNTEYALRVVFDPYIKTNATNESQMLLDISSRYTLDTKALHYKVYIQVQIMQH